MKDPDLVETARSLRTNQTLVERKLWNRLRNRQLEGHKFRRQFPILGYVLDFACEELRLGIELDGSQHNDTKAQHRDAMRTQALALHGWRILRFWNNETNENMTGVLTVIGNALREPKACRCPSPDALHSFHVPYLTSGASTSPRGEVAPAGFIAT